MSTALMKQLIAAVDLKHYDSVTRELLKLGVMHFIRIKELKSSLPAAVEGVTPAEKLEELGSLRRRIESFLQIIGVDPQIEVSLDAADLETPKKEKIEGSLDNIGNSIDSVREKQRQLQQDKLRLEEMLDHVSVGSEISPELLTEKPGMLTYFTGRVPKETLDDFTSSLKDQPAAVIPFGSGEDNEFIIVAIKKYRSGIEEILERTGWEKIDISSRTGTINPENLDGLRKKISAINLEQKELKSKVEETVRKEQDDLLGMWRTLKLSELYSSIEYNYGKTAQTMLFSGWVPRGKQKILDSAIRQASENTCYIEWHDPDEAVGMKGQKPPVKFTNPKFLQPFQMLVQNYAIPEYGTFDPTPVVAVAYLLMFGAMFGDVGHGAVILLAGIIGSILKRKEKIARLFQLIIYCGISAIVFGTLFGSYFGMPLFPPLWFDYHGAVIGHAEGGFVHNIDGILTLTVYFGIAVIGIGLLINWITCIRRKRWMRLFLDKSGLLGGWMYTGGLYTAFYFAGRAYKELPPGSLLIWLVGVPAVLFMAKPVIEFIKEKREHGKEFSGFSILDMLMEWIVEMLEIFGGYLANTLSFMRVAGLGIAHVSLMTAFFQIAGMIGNGSYNIGSYAILIFGNLLVIVLEGLSAGIQSLRLNYYEFFSKYFTGSGTAYSPVTLRRK